MFFLTSGVKGRNFLEDWLSRRNALSHHWLQCQIVGFVILVSYMPVKRRLEKIAKGLIISRMFKWSFSDFKFHSWPDDSFIRLYEN